MKDVEHWEAQDGKYRQEILEKACRLQRIRTALVEEATDLLGVKSVKYRGERQGVSASDGFDCSGFACHAIKAAVKRVDYSDGMSIEVPRHANEQWRGLGEFVHYERRMPGDLVYFAPKKIANRYVPTHVGIVVTPSLYIHAPGKDGTIIESAQLPEEQEILDDSTSDDLYLYNPVGIKRLTIPFGTGRWEVY